jgi:dye decolorizing peroxidase
VTREDKPALERSVSRRRLLQGGAALAGGAALGAAAVTVARGDDAAVAEPVHGADTLPFHGVHQAGVETVPQAHAWFVALDLVDGGDRSAAVRLMRLWTDDATRLTQGGGPLADQEPELAARPARLTVTLGFGPSLFASLGLEHRRPPSLRPLPAFAVDRLDPRWGEADLLLHVAADDLVTVSHAVRVLTRDARSLATVRWVQRGFLRARGTEPAGTTPRNLLGQVDGTVNPVAGTADFARAVWIDDGPEALRGGSLLVLRRIRFDLDRWEEIGRSDRELVIGRRIADGAPITGGDERTPVDLEATSDGLSVVPEFAHVRRARARNPDEVFLRRGYSFDDSDAASFPGGDTGLLFCSYQADIDRQFVPVQRRLADLDLLNRWTTPVGSAVFAILPGVREGGWLGESVLA